MRIAAVALIGALGLAVSAIAANAAPAAPASAAPAASNIIQVAQGCGPGGHRNQWGHCRPNYRPYAYRPHWRGYYGGGYGPYGWSDHVANELNRRQLWGGY